MMSDTAAVRFHTYDPEAQTMRVQFHHVWWAPDYREVTPEAYRAFANRHPLPPTPEQEVEAFLQCKRAGMNDESREVIDEWIAELRKRAAQKQYRKAA